LLVFLPFTRRREWLLLGLVGTACVLIGYLYVRLGRNAPRWGELGTEVAASHIFIAGGYRLLRERRGFSVPAFAPLAALFAGVLCYTSWAPWWSRPMLSPFLFGFAVAHLGQTYQGVLALLASKPLRMFGLWSFSIYLWQQPFFKEAGLPVVFALPLALTAGLTSYYLIERPARTWLNARRGAAAADAADWQRSVAGQP